MRTLWKILVTLIVLPLTYLLVVGAWLAAFDDVAARNASTIGTLTLALVVVLLVAIWLPSINRRWLAGMAGAAVALAGVLLTLLVGDLIFATTYNLTISGGVKAFGPVIAVILATQLMRRPCFTSQ